MRTTTLLLLLGCNGACDAETLRRLDPELALHAQARCQELLAEGQRLYGRGEFLSARSIFEESVTCAETAYSPPHAAVATYQEALGEDLLELDEATAAGGVFSRALALRQQTSGSDDLGLVPATGGIAEAERKLGHNEAAEPHFLQALGILNQPGVAPSLLSIVTRRRLSRLYVAQRQYRRAEELCQEALDIADRNGWAEHPETALTLNNLGNIYKNLSDVDLATANLYKAMDLLRKTKGDSHPWLSIPLFNLGVMAVNNGDCATGANILSDVYSRRVRTLGAGSVAAALALTALGEAKVFCNQVAPGMQDIDQGDSIIKKQGLADGMFDSKIRTRISYNLSRSNVEAARLSIQDYRQAARRANYIVIPDSSFVLLELYLSILNHNQEQIIDNIYRLLDADRAEGLDGNNVTALEVKELLAEDKCRGTGRLLRRVLEQDSTVESRKALWSKVFICKGESLRLGRIVSNQVAESQAASRREPENPLLAARHREAQLLLSGYQSMADPPLTQNRSSAVRLEKNILADGMAGQGHHHGAARQLADQIINTVKPDMAVVDIIKIDDADYAYSPPNASELRPVGFRYAAFVIRSGGQVDYLDLGAAEEIEDLAAEVYHHASNPEHRTNEFYRLSRDLYRRTLGKLRPYLSGVKQLVVVPDGVFNKLPVNLLYDGQHVLDERYVISYASSALELTSWTHHRASRDVLVLADPKLSVAIERRSAVADDIGTRIVRSLTDNRLKPLPGTRQEALAIEQLFPAAKVSLGSAASIGSLFRSVAPGILHIGTHARHLSLGDVPTPFTRRGFHERAPAGHIDPSLLSMIFLADDESSEREAPLLRAQRWGLGGTVTAYELAALNLWGTQLVVLATCASGLGEVRIGQGAAGLARAALAAGAETVVSSLWPVADGATSQLMAAFYRRLKAGAGRAQALHDAAREIRQHHPHPYYWTSFVLAGNPGPLRGIR